MSETKIGCNSLGCLELIILVFLIGAILIGVPTPWGHLNIDLFPPGIFLVK